MKHTLALVALLAAVPGAALAQSVPAATAAFDGLPTNTEVLVTVNDELNSKQARKGQLFDVSVSRDVMANGRVLIPRGTPGKGEIVYRTNKGAFGKSGKMEVVLRSLDVNGRTLPLTGRFRQEGQGNTGAVLGTVVLAGVIAGAFVTGHSAVIEQGRELKAFTAEMLPSPYAATAVAQMTPAVVPVAVIAPTPVPVVAMASAPVVKSVPVAMVSPPVPVAPVRVAAVTTVSAPTVTATQVYTPPSAAMIAVVRPVAVGAAMPVSYTPAEDPIAIYQRKLAAQRGVHGRNAQQGWSISD